MKKFNKLHSILLGFVAITVLFSACKEEDLSYKSGDAFHFAETGMSIAESSPSPAVIPIVFTKTSAVAGSVTVSITSSDAVENVDYVVLNQSLTFDFAADQYYDTLYIQPIDNTVQEADKTVNIAISGGTASLGYPGLEGGFSFDSLALVLVDDDCPAIATLNGSYTEVTNGGAGDGSGGIDTPLEPFGYGVTVTITSVGTDRYEIDDVTMGLYPVAYASSSGGQVNPATFDFNPTTKVITIDATASPDVVYGGDEFFGTGQAVDNCDGILSSIELSWANNWGDQGVSTLTPQ